MNIQWFPGHMAKTRRILSENLKLVDVVVELLDARIPASSKNPEIDGIIRNKPRVLVLNKSDLADDTITKEWQNWYGTKGTVAVPVNSIAGKGLKNLVDSIKYSVADKFERDRQKGRIFRPVRIMVVGIPNVGKSTLVNKIAGKAVAITGDRPGVTRGKQWIRLNPGIEMLDTPGILSPKLNNAETALNLAFTGAIRDEVIDVENVAASLAERLSSSYREMFKNRYKLQCTDGLDGLKLLELAGKNRGCILPGGNIDIRRIAVILLDEFRGGKIGRISLEKPAWNEEKKIDEE
ncbi:MAG: ribosome biogenesis GTPase YlqF [Bacillota bacterium]